MPGQRSGPRNNSGENTLRRPHRATSQVNKGQRANRDIQVPEVQLIDENGDNKGVVPTPEALQMAMDAGLDLVEISPSNKPPIAKILDHGRHKFLTQKKKAEAKKKQKVIEVKEIKMRPNIDVHDYDVKMRKMVGFFGEGDKVKVTMRFRGREMAHTELGMDLLMKVKGDTEKIAKVEAEPKMEGRQMMMVLSPR